MKNEEMIHWWKGYVVADIQGKKLERLINRMMYKRLSAWNLQRLNDEQARVCIASQDFLHLRLLLKETGCRVKIYQKSGLPFLWRKIKRQAGFYIGGLLFVMMLYAFSMMIWSVEIDGLHLPEDEVHARQVLEEMGVHPLGMRWRAEDSEEVRQQLMSELPNTTWIGFDYQGTVAKVEVVEKTMPNIPEPTSPRHLVAQKRAVIHDLFVEEGQAQVQPNQYVTPGQILISGYIGKEDEQQWVSAKGEVWGEIWYESEISLPLERERNVLSGDQQKQYQIEFGNWHIPVWGFGEVEYDQFLTREHKMEWTIRDWTLPIKGNIVTFYDSRIINEKLEEDQAYEWAMQLSRRRMQQQLATEADIIDENILKKSMENGKVYMKMHYTVLEDIASEQFIYQGD